MKHQITMNQLKAMNCQTWSKKSNCPRGCETVSINDLHVGDSVVINNYFHEIIEEENNMRFERIAEEVRQDAQRTKDQRAAAIVADETALQRNSTATRWAQYKNGTIDREAANGYAIARQNKAIDKETAEKLAHLERIANAPELDYISICVEWKRSSVWGFNPTAHINTDHERATGSASGCGYDKESAAIAEALNQCDSVLKALYTYKEQQLEAGKTDNSLTTCTGRDNRNIIHYGAGYTAIPYFESGVGVSCFWSIFDLLGYTVRGDHSGKHTDYYTITRK